MKIKALRTFVGQEGKVVVGSELEVEEQRGLELQMIGLAKPYEPKQAKQDKQEDKVTKEEKAAYSTKEEKAESTSTKRRGRPKKS